MGKILVSLKRNIILSYQFCTFMRKSLRCPGEMTSVSVRLPGTVSPAWMTEQECLREQECPCLRLSLARYHGAGVAQEGRAHRALRLSITPARLHRVQSAVGIEQQESLEC